MSVICFHLNKMSSSNKVPGGGRRIQSSAPLVFYCYNQKLCTYCTRTQIRFIMNEKIDTRMV